MFAVKSEYSIKTPSSLYTPFDTYFYVANDEVYFNTQDIASEIRGAISNLVPTIRFDNYEGLFVRKVDLHQLFADKPEEFKHRGFWSDVFANTDFLKVIAEVRDAQQFVKEYFRLDLPENWSCLNIDWVINTLPSRTSDWIEKCYKSLQILATNDEQKQAAHRVYDEAWKILKAREKAANANKRPTVHDTLATFGLTDDEFIHAVLDVHETKFDKQQARRKTEFDNQHNQLKDDLRRLLE